MYRITVLSTGKYGNAAVGKRYCFTKKSAKGLIDTFVTIECAFFVEKLIRIHNDVFCFSDCEENDEVLDYYYDCYIDNGNDEMYQIIFCDSIHNTQVVQFDKFADAAEYWQMYADVPTCFAGELKDLNTNEIIWEFAE